MNVLVIGGTRNLGHELVLALLARGDRVAVLNRGLTPDSLPGEVERLWADRVEPRQLAGALAGRSFDGVVDTALYTGPEAAAAVDVLSGRTDHYVFISSGQVYLVRRGLARPFAEEDYAGEVMAAPAPETPDRGEWQYGVDKRAAEDTLAAAWERRGFPLTTLRLPMVHGERDHFHRLHGYLARLADGGPILLPAGPHLPVRHVDVRDCVTAIVGLLASGAGKGRAYNLAQEETVTIAELLGELAGLAACPLRLVRVERPLLTASGLLPACSPFSNPWMSELDNGRSKRELGLVYTPLAATLERIVRHHAAVRSPPPPGYAQRAAELALARELASGAG